jgi:hypothetical protein
VAAGSYTAFCVCRPQRPTLGRPWTCRRSSCGRHAAASRSPMTLRHVTGPRGSRCHAADVEKASFTKRLIEHGSRVHAAAATDVQRALSRGSLLSAAISLARVRGVKLVVVAYNVATGLLAATLALAVGCAHPNHPSGPPTVAGAPASQAPNPEPKDSSPPGDIPDSHPLSHSRRPTPVTPSRSQRGGRELTRPAV